MPVPPSPLSRPLEKPHRPQGPAGGFWSNNVAVRDSTAKAGHLGVGGRGDRWVDRGPGARTSSDARQRQSPESPGAGTGLSPWPQFPRGEQAWSSIGMSDSVIQERGCLCPFKEKSKH